MTQATAFRLLLLISLLSPDVSIYEITQPDSLWKTTVPEILHYGSITMSAYFVGIDIFKYKYGYCIIHTTDQNVVAKFTSKTIRAVSNIGFSFSALYYPKGFYPAYSLKSLTRLRNRLVLLENYGSAEKMAHMNSVSYDNLQRLSSSKFSSPKYLELKNVPLIQLV